MALGLERAGLSCIALHEQDHWAAETLRKNRPGWNVIEQDIHTDSFVQWQGKVDVVSGGFPCQSFSYAGKKRGFEDARGTVFYEFARAVQEAKPVLCIGENVKGLLTHDNGRTLAGMRTILREIGYRTIEPKVLNALFYNVPQKRERLFLIGIRNDIAVNFQYPEQSTTVFTLQDALKKGVLYPTDVPISIGANYPAHKKETLHLVPPGGCWRNLPVALQRQYMQKSYYASGGKTGIARRMAWHEPCLTLTCSPAQKQTERCHPEETRPFTVREYARMQTFPDDWTFAGSMIQQYKQIGNAVPVNLAKALGSAVAAFLDEWYRR